jgi:hypothetical protein
VDYGLLVLRTPKLFVEAKPLGENLGDNKWAGQIMGYASVAGVEWIVLTDGNEYRIYNALAPIAVDDKLFRRMRVTDDDVAATIQTLELLAKHRLEENRIEVLWRAFFVDRQVRTAIEEMFTPEQDMLLVNWIQKRTKNLSVDEVRASLARCRVVLDFPVDMNAIALGSAGGPQSPLVKPRRKKAGAGKKAPKGTKASPTTDPTTVKDLIDAGLIKPPLKLVRTYKGAELTATVLKDGRIQVGTEHYDTLSRAGGVSKATISGMGADGSVLSTNGWEFWHIESEDGERESIEVLRKRFREHTRSAR